MTYNSFTQCNKCFREAPESFVRGGPTLTFFFLVDEGREDPSTTIIIGGPSSAHRETSRRRANDAPALNAGLVAVIFQGI